MKHKWRPSLWIVLGGALGATLALSLLGMIVLRYLGPEIGFRNAAYLLALGIGAATVVIWVLLLRLLLRPVTALAEFAAEVRHTSTAQATPPKHFGTRELHRMGQSVVEMASTLSNREQTVRNFTDHVIHEVKTPITTVLAASELLEDSEALSESDRVLVAQIRGAGQQMQAQLAALRDMVQARESNYLGETMLVSLFDTLEAEHPDISISVQGGNIPVPLSRKGLMLVLGHLIRNAAAHGASVVALALSADDGLVCLRIEDNGNGISDGNLSRIFDPFFTTRRETGGTGMGLYIVSNMLQTHGATIEHVKNDGGAVFLIRFDGA